MFNKRNDTLTFDQVLRTTNGYVNGVMMCTPATHNEYANSTIETIKTLDINDVHVWFGHLNKDTI